MCASICSKFSGLDVTYALADAKTSSPANGMGGGGGDWSNFSGSKPSSNLVFFGSGA